MNAILLALGLLTAYVFSIVTASLVRAFGTAGGTGLVFAVKYWRGWWLYQRSEYPDIVNVSLNFVHDGMLHVYTIMADRQLTDIWLNSYIAQRVRQAAITPTPDDPIVTFEERPPTSPLGLVWQRAYGEATTHLRRRLRYRAENIYAAVYNPLISHIAELSHNEAAVAAAAGFPCTPRRFVLALTYETRTAVRASHFRCMMIEERLLKSIAEGLPEPGFLRPEHAARWPTIRQVAAFHERAPERLGHITEWFREERSWAPVDGATARERVGVAANLERAIGIEPTTFSLGSSASPLIFLGRVPFQEEQTS